MITTTLADQIKMVDRCVNPDYIIIIKNKAGDMDFSQFKIVRPEEKIKIKPKKRFEITIVASSESKVYIIVRDNFEKREASRIECRLDKQEVWVTKMKSTYNFREVLKEI